MFSKNSKIEFYFTFISYIVPILGLFSLFTSGSISFSVFIFFFTITLLSWFLEGTKWQFSEKLGFLIIFLSLPVFYLDWKLNSGGAVSKDIFTASFLSRVILVLVSIKLFQKKSDRDWVLIYLISFFEILLVAGVGISPFFLLSLLMYLVVTFTTIILFEIRKNSNSLVLKRGKIFLQPKPNLLSNNELIKIPFIALSILTLVAVIAIPLFFMFPRVGGAGFGSNFDGLSSFTGFSDSVRLGEIGKLQQNDAIVMRVKLKSEGNNIDYLRWRGITLDTFDGQTWRRNRFQNNQNFEKKGEYFVLDNTNDISKLTTQTIYLEPIDSQVLFAMARPIAMQGNFEVVNRDSDGSLSTFRRNNSRISYKVFSDNQLPDLSDLKNDNQNYPANFNRYLQLPNELDERISKLAKEIINTSGAKNRYDQADSIAKYLQNNFGYTLDLKVQGNDPLSDFLFNVREGHCEYFASALAIMLRTQGIAARVVNGFQKGEYNETADVYVVRQRNAHSWVEVYFPKSKTWVPFDATPSAGQNLQEEVGLTTRLQKALEALETLWIQYVISYDNNEQRSLFFNIKNGLANFQISLNEWFNSLQDTLASWWQNVKGDNGLKASFIAIALAISYALGLLVILMGLIYLFRKLRKISFWKMLMTIFKRKNETDIVKFYQRMQKVLSKQGFVRPVHQTPLEFALYLNIPEVIQITEKYHEKRFGNKNLSVEEESKIENWLQKLEKEKS